MLFGVPLPHFSGALSVLCLSHISPEALVMRMATSRRLLALLVWQCAYLASNAAVSADEPFPFLLAEDFEHGMGCWQTTDPNPDKPFWKIESLPFRGQPNHVLRVTGPSDYQPPYRSPFSIALRKDLFVSDFELEVDVQNTNVNAGPHRDLCVFWGYQDPSHFYYVHYGAQPDPHACQIFIVNDAPRTMITVDQAAGTPWTDGWHRLKVVRCVEDGEIAVYFDAMDKPLMTARDKTFTWGQIGLGTFDDHGNFDNLVVRGLKVSRPAP
jgi:hypothetical protein